MGRQRVIRVSRQLNDSLLVNQGLALPTIVLHGECDGVHPPGLSEGQENLFSAHYNGGSFLPLDISFRVKRLTL